MLKVCNIDRPTKHFLALTNLTNISSVFKVGCFCKVKKICAVNCLYLVFGLLKII